MIGDWLRRMRSSRQSREGEDEGRVRIEEVNLQEGVLHVRKGQLTARDHMVGALSSVFTEVGLEYAVFGDYACMLYGFCEEDDRRDVYFMVSFPDARRFARLCLRLVGEGFNSHHGDLGDFEGARRVYLERIMGGKPLGLYWKYYGGAGAWLVVARDRRMENLLESAVIIVLNDTYSIRTVPLDAGVEGQVEISFWENA